MSRGWLPCFVRFPALCRHALVARWRGGRGPRGVPCFPAAAGSVGGLAWVKDRVGARPRSGAAGVLDAGCPLFR